VAITSVVHLVYMSLSSRISKLPSAKKRGGGMNKGVNFEYSCVWQRSTVTVYCSTGNVTNLHDATGLYSVSGIQTVAQNVGLRLLLSCYSTASSITLNSIMTSAQRVDHLWEVVVQLNGRSEYWVLHHSRICWHLLYAVTLFYLTTHSTLYSGCFTW
jgi:hypothetical protein